MQLHACNFCQVHTFREGITHLESKFNLVEFQKLFVQFISSKWWSAFFKSSLAKAVAARRLVHSTCLLVNI